MSFIADCLRDDGFLTLVSDDSRSRDLDAYVVGDLELHGLITQPGDRSEHTARGDDAIANLQRREERLHLLLTLAHRQHHHEVEDAEDQRERNELQPWVGTALLGRGHGQEKRVKEDHES